MTDRELLELILRKVTSIDGRVTNVEKDMTKMQSDVSDLKNDVSGLKHDVSDLKKDASGLKHDVSDLKNDVSEIKQTANKNYDKTVEFYAMQQEHNTEVSDTLVTITGELEMHNNQIAKNTAAIRRYK